MIVVHGSLGLLGRGLRRSAQVFSRGRHGPAEHQHQHQGGAAGVSQQAGSMSLPHCWDETRETHVSIFTASLNAMVSCQNCSERHPAPSSRAQDVHVTMFASVALESSLRCCSRIQIRNVTPKNSYQARNSRGSAGSLSVCS